MPDEELNFEKDGGGAENRGTNFSPAPKNLNRNQKIAIASLAVFAVFVVFLWSQQFKASLSGNKYAPASTPPGTELSADKEAENMTTKDTDKDGLSDWDEINTYKTSPYLEDSDSDGFLDKNEIDSSHDPNCPEGRDCYGVNTSATGAGAENSGSEESDLMLDALKRINQASTSTVSGQANDIGGILSGQTNAATLRKMLSESGADENMLKQFSDEELLKIYQEILKK